MKKFCGFVFVLILIMGCASTHQVKKGHGEAYIGEIEVRKSLVYVGSSIDDLWLVHADENGNAIISAGKGVPEAIRFYIPNAARGEYKSQLAKLIEWGDISAREEIETKKHVGMISTETGFWGGPVMVSTSFISGTKGESWLGETMFCQIKSTGDLVLGSGPRMKASPCAKELYFYLPPTSIAKLIMFLDKVPEYSTRAADSKSKLDMLR